jgi:hypothetical protein
MFLCRLCGLSIEAIPDDAVQVGKLQRFNDGEFHLLRKKLEPRTGRRPRKNEPDREAPAPIINASEVPAPQKEPTKERVKKKETAVFMPNETAMERAFRLAAI